MDFCVCLRRFRDPSVLVKRVPESFIWLQCTLSKAPQKESREGKSRREERFASRCLTIPVMLLSNILNPRDHHFLVKMGLLSSSNQQVFWRYLLTPLPSKSDHFYVDLSYRVPDGKVSSWACCSMPAWTGKRLDSFGK